MTKANNTIEDSEIEYVLLNGNTNTHMVFDIAWLS